MKKKNENDKTLKPSKDENENENEDKINMKIKTLYQSIQKTLMINCLKNTVKVKILSFINEFDCATNEEDKEKVVKELKDINSFVEHEIEIIEIDEMDEKSGYISKLISIINAIEYFLDEYSKK